MAGIRWMTGGLGGREVLRPGHRYCAWIRATAGCSSSAMARLMQNAGLPPLLSVEQWVTANQDGLYVTMIPFEVQAERSSGEVQSTVGVLASTLGAYPRQTAVGEFADGASVAQVVRAFAQTGLTALETGAETARELSRLPLRLAVLGAAVLAVAYAAGWRP